MAVQVATTGELDTAQRIAIEQTRFTAEHNAPCANLIEKMTLGKGEKSVVVPKVAQMTASSLVDGVDISASEDIGMTTTTLTSGEVGLKVILTDKLVRQQNEDVFRMVGRQMGDAMARKKDNDIIALFSALNGGTDLGAAGRDMEVGNAAILIGHAKANKFPDPVYVVHHPWALFHVAGSMIGGAGGAVGGVVVPAGAVLAQSSFGEGLMKDFFDFSLNGVPFYHDGNIAADASGDGIGAVFSKEAMVCLESVGFNQERERDASLRATELVVTADYGVFELDDTYGASCTFQVSAEATA